MDIFTASLCRNVLEISLDGNGVNTIAHMFWEILRESVLKVHHRLVEKVTSLDLLVVFFISFPVLVVDVDKGGMVDIFRDHLWQEESKQTDEAFNVLFSSEEDFFACDCRLPELSESVSFFIVED